MTKSIRSQKSRKAASTSTVDRPSKPYPEFPLCAANNGLWQKKINGKVHYFGRWGRMVNGKMTRLRDDGLWQDASALYEAQRDALYAGRKPRVEGEGLTVFDLCNRFRTAKMRKRDSGRLSAVSYSEYVSTTDRLVRVFGGERLVTDLKADDFEELLADISKTWGLVRVGTEITRVRSVFKYAFENGLIERKVSFGSEFKKPDKIEYRKHRAERGQLMIEATDLRKLLDALAGKPVETVDKKTGKLKVVSIPASPTMRAMVLLGLNAGLGNMDCATLPLSAINLDTGWLEFPRKKTGVDRRCPLWPETVEAIKTAIAERPKARQEGIDGLVFLTVRGKQCLFAGTARPVTAAFNRVLTTLKLHRPRIGFYTLRHVFRTIADGARDTVAANAIMGHADNSMASVYRERIDDDRLQAVVDHVRVWLFPETAKAPTDSAKPQRKRKQRQQVELIET